MDKSIIIPGVHILCHIPVSSIYQLCALGGKYGYHSNFLLQLPSLVLHPSCVLDQEKLGAVVFITNQPINNRSKLKWLDVFMELKKNWKKSSNCQQLRVNKQISQNIPSKSLSSWEDKQSTILVPLLRA
jgi:hypothetical protein